jgi:hypothetical protein
MNYKLKNIQLAIMFKGFINFDNREMWDVVVKEITTFKDSSPFIVPNDPNNPLPMEVPKIIFNSGTSQLTVSNTRMDLNFQLSNNIGEIEEKLNELLNVVLKLKMIAPFRIGIVLTCSLNNSDMLIKIKDLVKHEVINKSQEIQFAFLRTINKEGLEINNWVRYFYTPTLHESTFVIDINNSINTLFSGDIKNTNNVLKQVEEILNEFK